MFLLVFIQTTDDPTRYARRNAVARYVAVNYASCADNYVVPDFYTGKNRRATADETIVSNLYLTVDDSLFLLFCLCQISQDAGPGVVGNESNVK